MSFRTRWPSALFAVSSVAVLAAGPAAPPPQTPPSHTPFVTVLLRDWAAWDRDGNGVLSADEIDRAVRDPAVNGDDAAAAAALKLLSESKKLPVPLPPLTRAYFAGYDRDASAAIRQRRAASEPTAAGAESATVDTVQSAAVTRPAARVARLPVDWDLYFLASRVRIGRGGADPYPGRFVLDHTRQGPLGDCYFVAAVGAMAARDPAALAKILTPAGGRSFHVQFPGTPPVTVGPLTDAELAISSTTAGDGVWLALLEQGFGRGRVTTGTDDVEGVDQIKNGGSIVASIKLLTGHPARRVRFARTVEGRRALADKVVPLLRTELAAAMAGGRMVLASVHPPDPPTTQQAATRPALVAGTLPAIPPNVTLKHAYAVLAYDAKADAVTFWNPHGQTFHPRGPAGLANGYPTDHGRLTVPLSEAYQFVTTFAIERVPTDPTTRP